MDPRLIDHIERVREACGARISLAARAARVHDSACELVSEPVEIPDECREPPDEGYGRHLLYRCPERGFVVLALVWPEGTGTPPHDHGGWGVVAVAEGRIEVVEYMRVDDGTCEGYAKLEETGRQLFEPGEAAVSYPPHEDVHLIANAAPRTSLTIHTYACDIKSCRIFDLDDDRSAIKHLQYHTRFVGV